MLSDQHEWRGLRGGLRQFLAISVSRQRACSISIKCSDAAASRSRWGSDALLPPHACSEAVSVFLV